MPFQKGQSGNPGGRPKGLAATIRAKLGADGRKLVDAWMVLAFESPAKVRKRFGAEPTIRDRTQAMSELADRGFGKAIQPLTGEDGGPVRVTFGGRYRPAEPA